jgi:hypothetical protein
MDGLAAPVQTTTEWVQAVGGAAVGVAAVSLWCICRKAQGKPCPAGMMFYDPRTKQTSRGCDCHICDMKPCCENGPSSSPAAPATMVHSDSSSAPATSVSSVLSAPAAASAMAVSMAVPLPGNCDHHCGSASPCPCADFPTTSVAWGAVAAVTVVAGAAVALSKKSHSMAPPSTGDVMTAGALGVIGGLALASMLVKTSRDLRHWRRARARIASHPPTGCA